jgi:hypothetical protein
MSFYIFGFKRLKSVWIIIWNSKTRGARSSAPPLRFISPRRATELLPPPKQSRRWGPPRAAPDPDLVEEPTPHHLLLLVVREPHRESCRRRRAPSCHRPRSVSTHPDLFSSPVESRLRFPSLPRSFFRRVGSKKYAAAIDSTLSLWASPPRRWALSPLHLRPPLALKSRKMDSPRRPSPRDACGRGLRRLLPSRARRSCARALSSHGPQPLPLRRTRRRSPVSACDAIWAGAWIRPTGGLTFSLLFRIRWIVQIVQFDSKLHRKMIWSQKKYETKFSE